MRPNVCVLACNRGVSDLLVAKSYSISWSGGFPALVEHLYGCSCRIGIVMDVGFSVGMDSTGVAVPGELGA